MSQLRVSSDHAAVLFRTDKISRLAVLLLIFTPLVYSNDGDSYRAYKVVFVGMLFMLGAVPNLFRPELWIQSGIAWILPLALVIVIQPLFVAEARILYNLQFVVVFLCCFLPVLCFANSRPSESGDVRFISRALRVLFSIAVISLLASSFFRVGEIYQADNAQLTRAFSWLGDSFSPVMVFFLYYFVFRRSAIGVLLSAACIVGIMQAKMALGMAILGFLTYLFLIGSRGGRLLVMTVIALGVLYLSLILETASATFHNFEYSLNTRLLSLEAGMAFFRSSPWFGVGANQTFTLLSSEYDLTNLNLYENSILLYEFFQIHNAFLRILAELGLIGFLFFALLCTAIIRKSRATLISAHKSQPSESRDLLMALALWLISFVLFYQTTGWFEPGNPQLSWLVCFLTLMNILETKH